MKVSKKDQIKKLIQKSKENLKVAEYLFDEEFYDISITRAYYAMFYLATAALLSIDRSFSKHSGVISAFGKEFAATKIINPDCHRMLIEASKDRKTGDYDFMTDLSKNDAKETISNAKKFSEEVLRYLEQWMKKNAL